MEIHGSIWTDPMHGLRFPGDTMSAFLCRTILRAAIAERCFGPAWSGSAKDCPRDVWDNAQQAVCAADVLLVVGNICRCLSGRIACAARRNGPEQ